MLSVDKALLRTGGAGNPPVHEELGRREAGPPNQHDDKVDSGAQSEGASRSDSSDLMAPGKNSSSHVMASGKSSAGLLRSGWNTPEDGAEAGTGGGSAARPRSGDPVEGEGERAADGDEAPSATPAEKTAAAEKSAAVEKAAAAAAEKAAAAAEKAAAAAEIAAAAGKASAAEKACSAEPAKPATRELGIDDFETVSY